MELESNNCALSFEQQKQKLTQSGRSWTVILKGYAWVCECVRIAEYIFTHPPPGYNITGLHPVLVWCNNLLSVAAASCSILSFLAPWPPPTLLLYVAIFCASERVTVGRCQGFNWGVGQYSSTTGTTRKRPIYHRVVSSSRVVPILLLLCLCYDVLVM